MMAERALKIFSGQELAGSRQPIGDLANEGLVYLRLGKHRDAVNIFNAVIDSYKRTSPAISNRIMATALVNRGVGLHFLKKIDLAIKNYDEALNYLSAAPPEDKTVAAALINKASALSDLKRYDKAAETCLEFVYRHQKRATNNLSPSILETYAEVVKGIPKSFISNRALALFDTRYRISYTTQKETSSDLSPRGHTSTDDPQSISDESFTNDEWEEVKLATLELLQANSLDSPEQHLAYIRSQLSLVTAHDT